MRVQVKLVLPGAISTLPERRWTAANGTVMAMKNVDLVRDSQVCTAPAGSAWSAWGASVLRVYLRRFASVQDIFRAFQCSACSVQGVVRVF